MSTTDNVRRIYPGSKNGLINWIEEHFHEIDEFVMQVQMKDNTAMFVYDTYSYRNALGMVEMARDSIHELSHNDGFIPKERL